MVDRGHGVELNTLSLKNVQSAHHPVECRETTLVAAVSVMNILGAVQGYSHKETIVVEKSRPLAVQKGAVGLDGVVYDLAAGMFPFIFKCLAIEVKPQDQRLAAVPVERHFRHLVGVDIFINNLFQHFLRHPWLPSAVDFSLVEVVAVLAVKVAERPRRLDHYVESHRSGKPDGVAKRKCLFKCRV